MPRAENQAIHLTADAGEVAPGCCYLSETPALETHIGSQPDLFLAWTAVGADASELDVVLYFHGFAVIGEKTAQLRDFVAVSGLDPGSGGKSLADRKRPTLAIVPRGSASPERSPHTPFWPYAFPALAHGGAATLVSDLVRSFSAARQAAIVTAPPLQVGRFIVAGHSGGGRGVVGTLAGGHLTPDEVYLFDALYGDPGQPLSDWIDALVDSPSRRRRLWIGYLPGTADNSRLVERRCEAAIAGAAAGLQAGLRQRLCIVPVEGGHMDVPRRYARSLLAADEVPPSV